MVRKNDYRLLFGPAASDGSIVITAEQLRSQIRLEQQTGLMDYLHLDAWLGLITVRPLDADGVRRAMAGHGVWGEALPEGFPPDFVPQMRRLLDEVGDAQDGELRVQASTAAEVGVRCEAAP